MFSERIETLRWLERQLTSGSSAEGHAGRTAARRQLCDTEQQELVDRFGRLDDPIRVLLCSDVASRD